MEWLNTLMAWVGLIAWLGLGGWAFGHHHENVADENIPVLLIFSALLGPFFAGMAVWEITRGKDKSAK